MADSNDINEDSSNVLIAEYSNVQIFFYKPKSSSKAILYTQGLSAVNQQELAGQENQVYAHVELYFLLPTYWDVHKENQQWPVSVLKRLIAGQKEKQAWFGPGDTLSAHAKTFVEDNIIDNGIREGKALETINSIFKQTHFILAETMAADKLLETGVGSELNYDWLAIVPIFQKEFEYKNSRSALELMMKFKKNNVTEELDEHRPVIARKKFFGLF